MFAQVRILLASAFVGVGIFLVAAGLIAIPSVVYADGTGPTCNEGGDPSMPKGCFGTCYSPKVCEAHPIHLVCKCR